MVSTQNPQRRSPWLVATAYVLVWLLLAVPLACWLFLQSSTTITLASHEAEVSPTTDGRVTVRSGPFLPDLRADSGAPLGVEIVLGKTETTESTELVERYAFIASQPGPQVTRVEEAVRSLAYDAAARAALIAVVPLLVWALIGRRRRAELVRRATPVTLARTVIIGATVLALAAVAIKQPWRASVPESEGERWLALPDYVPDVTVPPEARGIEVSIGGASDGTRRLIESAIDTYRTSKTFYDDATEAARALALRVPVREGDAVLREPEDGETVALLVSDRHDNVGMDPVARAIGDAAGATVILDAGDDTSTGQEWEAFSLDSLEESFSDYEQRWAVQGNHDHGTFVGTYLENLGWTLPSGTSSDDDSADTTPIEGPGGGRLLAWNDPRSSGLGTWRDESGMTFSETAEAVTAAACGSEERVNTLLVHDSNLGKGALEQGCVDLVVSGHLHVQVGPDQVVGQNGQLGYRYTNGTTGGAAYAIAVGSKLRRPAQVTLVTYRDGRPVGIQPVTLQTNGVFVVDEFEELELSKADDDS